MAKATTAKKIIPAPKQADLVVYDCPQGSADWYEAKRGIISTSHFSKIMAGSEDRLGRVDILRKLAGEKITGRTMESYSNGNMDRGKVVEPEAREWYARTRFVTVETPGFVYNPDLDAGWSPDGIVGRDGAVEFKSAAAHVMIALLERGTFPSEHRAQCYGALLVGRRKWIDLVVYCPGLPKYVGRIHPDENDVAYLREMKNEIETFNWDLRKLCEKIGAIGRNQ